MTLSQRLDKEAKRFDSYLDNIMEITVRVKYGVKYIILIPKGKDEIERELKFQVFKDMDADQLRRIQQKIRKNKLRLEFFDNLDNLRHEINDKVGAFHSFAQPLKLHYQDANKIEKNVHIKDIDNLSFDEVIYILEGIKDTRNENVINSEML